MTYRHFDLADVECQIRKVYGDGLVTRIANAKTDTERQGYQLQDRMFEPQLACQLQVFAMINEGVSEETIAKVIGAFISNVFVNAVAASERPDLTAGIIFSILSNGFQTLSGKGDGSIHYADAEISPVRGGRA